MVGEFEQCPTPPAHNGTGNATAHGNGTYAPFEGGAAGIRHGSVFGGVAVVVVTVAVVLVVL